jgi:hypothetical protein
MDRETLCAQRHFQIRESSPYLGEPTRLNAAEQAF